MIIKNLSFKFEKSNKQSFFQDLTIKFAPHEVHFIQGDNGVGKSTLFTIIQGTTSKDVSLNASIELDGITYHTHMNTLPHSFTEHVHTVQQQYDNMIANQFTFMENLQLANLPQYPHLKPLPPAIIFDVTKTLSIDLNKPAYLLSGGQRQLLAILMALQKPTKLLLLDEPTATLDKKNADLIIQCLFQLAAQLQVTMLIICHDKELIRRYAQENNFIIQQKEDGTRVIDEQSIS